MTRDAHYLHKKPSLVALLRAPLERPRAMAWVPGTSRLIVAGADGELLEVDPIFGTRTLKGETHDPGAVAISPDGKHMALVERGVGLSLHQVGDGKRLAHLPLPLLSDLVLTWFRRKGGQPGICAVGDTADQQRLALVADAQLQEHRSLRLPPRTIVGVDSQGRLLSARSLVTGPTVAPFGRPLKKGELSAHRLRFGPRGLLVGVATGGVTLWTGPQSTTAMLYDVTAAAVSEEGRRLVMGTRDGTLALADLSAAGEVRAHPEKVSGHSSGVRALSFAPSGDWLASMGDTVRLWRLSDTTSE